MKCMRITRSYKICFVAQLVCPWILLCMVISCTTVGTHDAKLIDQLKAENRVCSQNLNLFMRQNEVLKEENAKYKKENADLRSKNSILQSDLSSLQTKYKNDIAMWTERHNALQHKYDVLVKQSDEKIQELEKKNKELERTMAQEIARLTEIIRKQEVECIHEKESLKNQLLKVEMDYQKTIDVLQKNIVNITSENEQLKSKLTEAELLIKKLQTQILENSAKSPPEDNRPEPNPSP